jgi:hypothetical protein
MRGRSYILALGDVRERLFEMPNALLNPLAPLIEVILGDRFVAATFGCRWRLLWRCRWCRWRVGSAHGLYHFLIYITL